MGVPLRRTLFGLRVCDFEKRCQYRQRAGRVKKKMISVFIFLLEAGAYKQRQQLPGVVFFS
jgi:hypothetical protein